MDWLAFKDYQLGINENLLKMIELWLEVNFFSFLQDDVHRKKVWRDLIPKKL